MGHTGSTPCDHTACSDVYTMQCNDNGGDKHDIHAVMNRYYTYGVRIKVSLDNTTCIDSSCMMMMMTIII
jgi:hypothetical protein